MVWQVAAAVIGLGTSLYSAKAQMQSGKAQLRAANINAYNLDTQKIVNAAETMQRNNDRIEEYQSNLSSSIAQFAAQGRDVGADRSVAAFLNRQKEVVGSDLQRSDFMGFMESARISSQAAAVRAEGIAAKQAAYVGAYTTIGQGLYNFSQTMAGMGGSSSGGGGAPATSVRPKARPW